MAMGEGMKKSAHHVCRVCAASAVESESTSFSNDSSSASVTSSSTDPSDDASSPSPTSCTSPVEAGDETSLMNQFPVRRGLSKFYKGKSQSYQSLSYVKSIEDLPKKVIPFNGKMKQSSSYAGGLDGCNSRSSSSSSSSPYYGCAITNKGAPTSMRSSSAAVLGSCKPPPVPAAPKNLV